MRSAIGDVTPEDKLDGREVMISADRKRKWRKRAEGEAWPPSRQRPKLSVVDCQRAEWRQFYGSLESYSEVTKLRFPLNQDRLWSWWPLHRKWGTSTLTNPASNSCTASCRVAMDRLPDSYSHKGLQYHSIAVRSPGHPDRPMGTSRPLGTAQGGICHFPGTSVSCLSGCSDHLDQAQLQ